MECTWTLMLSRCEYTVHNKTAMQMLYRSNKPGLLIYTKTGVCELIGAVGHQFSV